MFGGGDGRIWSLILEERTRIVRVAGRPIPLQFLPLPPLVTEPRHALLAAFVQILSTGLTVSKY